MSRSESVILTVRSREVLLQFLECQREFVVPPRREELQAICAVSVDYLGIPNWDIINTESRDDLFDKMNTALRHNGICGFHLRYFDMQFSVYFLDDNKRGRIAVWNRLDPPTCDRLVGNIPDPRKSIEIVLLSLGSLVDEIDRVAWEYGE